MTLRPFHEIDDTKKAITAYFKGTGTADDFAEAFAHYCLGMDLAPEFKALFDEMR